MGKPKEEEKELFGDEEMEDHVVTQEDLDANPELVDEGVEVGETIQLPKVATEDEEEVENGEVEDEVEDEVADSKIPSWARAKGVKVTKKDEANFFPKVAPKKVNRETDLPEWSKTEVIR